MDKQINLTIFLITFYLISLTGVCFLVPPAVGFQQPELARIIFFHVPCAIIGAIFLIASSWFGYKYLKNQDLKWDFRANACLELSWLLTILTLSTGILFSKVQWGAWWQWDPRQTSYLMLFLILSAALILRQNIPNHNLRAKTTAVYMLASLMPALFLVFVFPRLPQIQSFHPSQTLLKGELDASYTWVLRSSAIILLYLCTRIYKHKSISEIINKENQENANPELAIHHFATPVTHLDNTGQLSHKTKATK